MGVILFLALASAQDVLRDTDVRAGLAVHLGSADGRLEVELAGPGRFLVHGLALSDEERDRAREAIHAAGLYGLASVERAADLRRLPYSDHQVNLLVADLASLGERAPSKDEIARVLVPGSGAAMLFTGGGWRKITKPRPAGMDEWTHWGYDASGVGASRDTFMKPANSIRWIANNWETPQMHPESPTGMRVAGGRVAYAFQKEGKGKTNHLLARDAFNGIAQWRREDFSTKKYPFVLVGDRLYTYLDVDQHAVALDAATGEIVRTYDQGQKWMKPKIDRNTNKQQLLWSRGKLLQTLGNELVILDAATGAVEWKYADPEGDLNLPVVGEKEESLFAVVSDGDFYHHATRWPVVLGVKHVACLDLQGRKVRWRTALDTQTKACQIAYHEGFLALFNTNSIGGDQKSGYSGAIRTSDGKLLWLKPYSEMILNMMIWNGMLVYSHGQVFFRDLETGAESRLPTRLGYNPRCVRMTGSRDWIVTGITSYLDADLNHTMSGLTRSQCATGGLPAYGMVYFTAGGCQCIHSPVRGYQAQAYENPLPPVEDAGRLEALTGPKALTQTLAAKGPIVEDWTLTTFEHSRETRTAPVTAGALVLVAVVHEHRLEARREGNLAWSFIAGGRISSPPVVREGRIYFGSHDGWVYAVQLADGKPLWRFRAAPADKKITAYSQLESAWPVYGVIFCDDRLVFSAGRHAEADGGIRVYALDPATGKMEWAVNVATERRVFKATERMPKLEYPLWTTVNGVLRYEEGKLWFPGGFKERKPMAGAAIDPKRPRDIIDGKARE